MTSLYYHWRGRFTIQDPIEEGSPSDRVISPCSDIDDRKLILDCSLRFFSDGNQPDGTFQVNSFNSRFFGKTMPLTLETVFILLGQNPTGIIGSPLFLKLPANSPVAL